MPTQTIINNIANKKTDSKSITSSQVNSLNISSFKQIFADHAPKAIKAKESTETFQDKQVIQKNNENSENIGNHFAGKAEEKAGSHESTNEKEETKQDQAINSENSVDNLELKVDESISLDLNVVEQLVDSEDASVKVNNEATDLKEDDVLVEQDESVNDLNASKAKVNNTASIIVEPSENKSLGTISNDKVSLEVKQDAFAKNDQKKIIEDFETEKAEITENNQAINPQIIQIFDKTQDKPDSASINLDPNHDAKNLGKMDNSLNEQSKDLGIIINEDATGNMPLDELVDKASGSKNISDISGAEKKDATKFKEQPQLAESISKNLTNLQDESTIKSDLQEGANNGQNFEQQNIPDLGKITFGNEKLNISFKEVANNFSDNIPHRADQISLAIKAGVQNGRKEISINMYPETLGNVDVKLEFNKDQIVAIKIFAEKAETLNILIKDIAVLEKSLSEVVKADNASLSFNLKDGQNGNEYGPADKQVSNNRAVADDESVTITKNYQVNKLSSQSDGVDIRV